MTTEGFDQVHVTLRGSAAGAITRNDIERRAGELALIRSGSHHFSKHDLAAAEAELLGHADPDATADDARPDGAATRDPQFVLQQDGESPVREGPEDENTAPEALTLQGVEEAQHDLMVSAQEDEALEPESDDAISPPESPSRPPIRRRSENKGDSSGRG